MARIGVHSRPLFRLFYHRLLAGRADPTWRMRTFGEVDERHIDAVVRGVRENGIARWPGLFADEQFLTQARELVQTNRVSLDTALSQQTPVTHDEENGRFYYVGQPERLRTLYDARRPSQCRPEIVDRIMRSAELTELAFRYQGTLNLFGVLAESLTVSDQDQKWHVDLLGDQIKAMILLTDVGPENGPLEYKVGTHRYPFPSRWRPDHRRGLGFKGDIDSLPGPIVTGTGKAGECIFFDSHGIHRGTRCRTGERLTLVAYYQFGRTPRNDFVRLLESATASQVRPIPPQPNHLRN